MLNKINIVFLFLSLASLLTGIFLYLFTDSNLITTFQLLFSSISSIALFASITIVEKSTNSIKSILISIGYLTFISFIITFFQSELLIHIWNIQISLILLLLFSALDSKLETTKFYENVFFKWIYRIGSTFLILSTLLKLDYTFLYSVGSITLIALSSITIGGIISSKKS